MHVSFPPVSGFVWAYYLLLVGLLLIATYTDYRYMRIPNWLTVPIFALGFVLNVTRGIWIGGSYPELQTWVLPEGSAWLGGLDGFLFSLAGFAVGFGLFFFMWIMGVCRAGDVKLFGAIGAYVGPVLAIVLLAATVVLVGLYSMLRLARLFARRGLRKKTGSKRLVYAPALALSATLVLLWVFRDDLGLAPPDAGRQAKAEPMSNK